MSRTRRLALPAACGLLLFSPLLAAENWPQWRGPQSQGVSSETGLPVQWSAEKNLAWKAPLAGAGVSSPVVWGDRVIVTSQTGRAHGARGSFPLLARDDSTLAEREHPIQGARPAPASESGDVFLVVEAFRRSDGSRLWEYRVKATGEFPDLHEKHNLATPTPVVDGERVYAWFGNGQIVALDLDGRAVWTRHLGLEISPFRNPWGHGSSPALYGDTLILLCDHRPRSYLLALDRRTGKQRWLADRGQGRTSHSTPLVVRGPNGDELIVNSSERIDAYDPATGKPLWYAGSERQTPIPTAVSQDGVIYLSRGYRNSDYLAIRAGRERRCEPEPRPVAHSERSVLRAVHRPVPGPALHDQRDRRGDLRRGQDRRAGLAAAARRRVLCVSGRRRREDLHGERNRDNLCAARRPPAGGAGGERSRGAVAGLAGDLERAAVSAQRRDAVRGEMTLAAVLHA